MNLQVLRALKGSRVLHNAFSGSNNLFLNDALVN